MKKILTTIFLFFSLNSKAQTAVDSILNKFVNDWIGKPYRYGGKTIRGIDCSALVQTFYKLAFVMDIPRTCASQFKAAEKVLLEEIRIGDILYFKSKRSPSGWHCGIFIGDNKFFHAANRSEGVKINLLTDGSYLENLRGVGRFN